MNQNLTASHARQKQIARALRGHNLAHSEAGELLLGLSAATKIDSLEVLENEILLDGDEFGGSVVWHVTLAFPEPGGSPLVASETLPGSFHGHFEKEVPVFDSLDVDLGSLSQAEPTPEDGASK